MTAAVSARAVIAPAEVVGRFAAAYPGRLAPQVAAFILDDVASLTVAEARRAGWPGRADVALLAYHLATAGDSTAAELAPILGRGASALHRLIPIGRAIARQRRGAIEPTTGGGGSASAQGW